MHEAEVHVDVALVRQLLADQHPELAARTVTPVDSAGTVNAIFRLGEDLYVRLPRVPSWAEDLTNEARWLPRLAPHLSLEIPEPVAAGRPTETFPFPWAVYRWIQGTPYAGALVDDEVQAARDLARFVAELRSLDPGLSGRAAGRRPLAELDTSTRAAIGAADLEVDRDAALAAWERALRAEVWNGEGVWIHSDLLPPNLLVRDGRLCAVIDFGGVGVGDPAADVVPAWSVFDLAGRAAFRDALDVDDGTWERARGYALHQAAMIIPYYRETHRDFAALATRTVERLLEELRAEG